MRADLGVIIQRVETVENELNENQRRRSVKGILKMEKNMDGNTGKTDLYFDYPRSRILTNEKYMGMFRYWLLNGI